jgi:hypothetical protein
MAAALGAFATAGRFAGLPLSAARAEGRAVRTSKRLCIAEFTPFREDPPDKIQRRFDLYKQLGFGTLRTNIAWRQLETSPGNWRIPDYLRHYLAMAAERGFRLKISPETMGGPPGWFLNAHPDMKILNAENEFSQSDLSLWHPDLRTVLAAKTDALFRSLAELGVFRLTDFIFADLGPASEPIYPAAWTQGKANCRGSSPWFYGDRARDAFAAAMATKYRDIAAANLAWGTSFTGWATVSMPLPGETPGRLWDDALIWYRDSKRDFIRWQVANYRQALNRYAPGAHINMIIFVSGHHIEAAEWAQSVRSGLPDCQLTIMSDSEFLIDLASETGCWLQYPAVENDEEASYLHQYVLRRGLRTPMWGENVGVEKVADDPGHLADVVLADDFYGLDYVRSKFLFGADGVTPNETFAAAAQAFQRLLNAWA